MKFSKDYINNAIKDLNFQALSPIQIHAIPAIRKGKDVIGCSETGSGKTHAFLLPLFEKLDEANHDLQILILSPTRELADQILKVARHIASFSETVIDIRSYTGGQDRSREVERLKKSQPHIAIGTPGKINDLVTKENVLKAYRAKHLVIDEADMALEIGFLEDIDAVASKMGKDLQMMVFSATIPEKLGPFLRKYLNNPEQFMLTDKSLKKLSIEHIFIKTTAHEKNKRLEQLLPHINPYLAMIFVNKKEDVEGIQQMLHQKGLKVTGLHGDLQARKRKQVLREIENLQVQYVVASDIASRGLDIDGVSHVINIDLPHDMNFYIHRVGRTGRMQSSGIAYTFYTNDNDEAFEFLEKQGIEITHMDLKKAGLVKRVMRSRERPQKEMPKPTSKLRDKSVKPGYKKKYHQERVRMQKKENRKRGK